jgi:alpha(1,3/1,4) fucosyltransferase
VDKNLVYINEYMKKFVMFREKRFDNNNFCNTKIDPNLSPFYYVREQYGEENFVSYNTLQNKNDRQYTILCFLTPNIINIFTYIKLFFITRKLPKYLFLFEPPVVAPLSYIKVWHIFFDRIYTWDDDLVDNKKYFKFIWPQSSHKNIDPVHFTDKKFVCLINGNKSSFIKNELYSARENAIRYFEQNGIDFDLYGVGWNKKNIKQKFFGYSFYPSYRWKVDDKLAILSQYKFTICFENMHGKSWYITEKIWDAFKAKTVPIYRWAANIEQYIPKNCFIDFRNFHWNYSLLTEYMRDISETEYNAIIKNIEHFLDSPEAKKRFDHNWAIHFLSTL